MASDEFSPNDAKSVGTNVQLQRSRGLLLMQRKIEAQAYGYTGSQRREFWGGQLERTMRQCLKRDNSSACEAIGCCSAT
jgi:hypothetical protein